MDIVNDIQPLSAFRARSAAFVRRLKQTGRPIVLTIDGKAAVVVQDAAAYQRLCDAAARAGAPAETQPDPEPGNDMFDEMRRRLGLSQ